MHGLPLAVPCMRRAPLLGCQRHQHHLLWALTPDRAPTSVAEQQQDAPSSHAPGASASGPSSDLAPPTPAPEGPRTPGSGFAVTASELEAIVEAALRSQCRMDASHAPVELAQALRTSLTSGLQPDPAALAERARVFGTNRLPSPDVVSFWELVLDAMKVREAREADRNACACSGAAVSCWSSKAY